MMSTKPKTPLIKRMRGAIVASALILVSSALLAQSNFGAALFARLTDRQQALLSELNLTPAQLQQAAALQQQAKATRASALTAAATTATLVKRDLKNPQSNLRATTQMVQTTVDQQIAQHRALTAERLRFYDSLSPAQQAVIRAEAVTRIEKLERLRDALLALSDDF
jgi:DNA-binding transcriptional regulator YdaS (Cro superfamily)